MTVILNNRYRILQVLGSGGFGQTFLSEDTHLPSGRKCVVKQLKPATDDLEIWQLMQDRFQREAAILELLGRTSDQIPELYAYFTEANQFYLVQELIEGETLKQAVQLKGACNEKRTRQILLSLLSVLESVHSRGIIHRDIKPDNIIIRAQDDTPVLIDFGAVKEIVSSHLDSQGSPTSSIRIGSPGFMPLEQASGKPVFASDLYSLALTAVFLLTGKSPQVLADHSTGEISWQPLAPGISKSFADVINKAIEPDFRERFKTAREMIEALDEQRREGDQRFPITPRAGPASPAFAATERVRRIIVGTPVANKIGSAVSHPEAPSRYLGAKPAAANYTRLENQPASSPSIGHSSARPLSSQRRLTERRGMIAALIALSCFVALIAGLALYYRRTHSAPADSLESVNTNAASPAPTAGSQASAAGILTGSPSPSQSAVSEATASVDGQWSMTVSDDKEPEKEDPEKGILTLKQAGNDLTGHISFEEDDKTTSLPLTGTITANRILLTVFHQFTRKELEDNKDDEETAGAKSFTIVFTGVADETKMTGTVTGLTDNRKSTNSGKWTATKQ